MINEELKSYLKDNIAPLNNLNEQGHNMDHINYVIKRSLKFAKEVPNINLNMVYTIAYYHDIAHHLDAKNHELLGSNILKEDKNLLKWFTKEEIDIMSEAVKEHRASKSTKPHTIYGCIVSSADRNTDIESPFKRTYTYRIEKNPDMPLDEIIKESQLHMQEKFGTNGYAKDKMYFKDDEYDKFLKDLNKIIYNDSLFKKEYLRINNINEKESRNNND